MTRINASIPVEELSYKHLLAEHHEIKRVCARLRKQIQMKKFDDIPAPFNIFNKFGEIVFKELFWLDKGKFTLNRYFQIHNKCKKRGFNVTDFNNSWDIYKQKPEFFNNHIPTEEQIQIIKDRIALRIKQANDQKKTMKMLIFLFIFIFITLFSFGQKIYITKAKYEADFSVYVTKSEYNCNLKVFVTKNRYEVKNDLYSGIWFYTDKKYESDFVIYFTFVEYDADFKICYVNTKQKAGKTK